MKVIMIFSVWRLSIVQKYSVLNNKVNTKLNINTISQLSTDDKRSPKYYNL